MPAVGTPVTFMPVFLGSRHNGSGGGVYITSA